MKEGCLNCAHKGGCLLRGMAHFQILIAAGWDDMTPEAREKLYIRPSCGHWEQNADQEPDN